MSRTTFKGCVNNSYIISVEETGEKLICRPFSAYQDTSEDRFKNVVNNMADCHSFYGLWRLSKLKMLRKIMSDCNGPDFVSLVEASLYGKIIQVNKPLFISKLNAKWRAGHEYKNSDLLKVMDSRKRNHSITFPWISMLVEMFQVVKDSPLPVKDKSRLFMFLKTNNYSRWIHAIRWELQRLIELVADGRYFFNWGDNLDSETGKAYPDLKTANKFYAGEILKRLEETLLFYKPDLLPGFYFARAKCLYECGRNIEAISALEQELSEYPWYVRAVDLLEKIKDEESLKKL